MKAILLTNNPLVRDRLSQEQALEYHDVSFREILVLARDRIHRGHRLLTHPLSGSIKPNETPYKSMLLTEQAGALDVESLEIIENAIATCDKFPIKFPAMTEGIRADFQLLDFTLISSAL